MADTSNDIYNTYKECAECGDCCKLTVLAMSHDEVAHIQAYIEENDIAPVDQGPGICPFRGDDMRCRIYPVRAKTCRLHSCQATRNAIAEAHPELDIPDDLPLVDLRRAFIHGDLRDPRTIPVDRIIAHYSR